MSIERVLRGIETMRTLLNQKSVDPGERLNTAQTLIEEIRNDAQDLRDSMYESVLDEIPSEKENATFTDNEVLDDTRERLFRYLSGQNFTDLAAFYGLEQFASCADDSYRFVLAENLIRVAKIQGFGDRIPKLWMQVFDNIGTVPKEG